MQIVEVMVLPTKVVSRAVQAFKDMAKQWSAYRSIIYEIQRNAEPGWGRVDRSTSLLARTWRSGSGSGLFLRRCWIRVAILCAWAASEDFGVDLLFMLILVSCLWRNVTVSTGELTAFSEPMPGYRFILHTWTDMRQTRRGFMQTSLRSIYRKLCDS